MKMLLPDLKKITASLMAAMFLSMPMASLASAAEFYADNTVPQKTITADYQYYGHDWDDDDDYRYWCHRHHRYHKHGYRCRYHDHDRDRDHNGNAVTGFIIGAVVGAVVAKNT